MPLTPGTVIEEYEIIETIGTGAMSTVYLGKKDSNSYAIKELTEIRINNTYTLLVTHNA